MSRVALIGLDAADWNFMEDLIGSGYLPTLARLRRESATCSLSHRMPFTERVWETLLLGGDPPTTGVVFDGASYRTFHRGARPDLPFFARAGLGEVVAFDVPWMSLAHGVEGVQITGWGEANLEYPRAARPPGLLREIEARFGPHPARTSKAVKWFDHDEDSLDSFVGDLVEGARRRVEICRWLLARAPDWRLFITAMSEAHLGGELLWHGIDGDHPLADDVTRAVAHSRLTRIYSALDLELSRLIESLPSDTHVIVFSLQGMERNLGDLASTVLLPELLHRWEFQRAFLSSPDNNGWKERGCPPIVPPSDQTWWEYMDAAIPTSRTARVKGAVGSIAPWLVRLKRRFDPRIPGAATDEPIDSTEETTRTPEEIGEPLAPLDYQIACRFRPLWNRMKAFALPSYSDGRIRVNLQSRESKGVVPPAAYAKLCDDVEALLTASRDPRTGSPVIGDIYRPRESDPFDPQNPEADLIVEWSACVDALEYDGIGMVGPFPFYRTGGHTPHGFALVAGPGIEPQDVGERPARDLARTAVALLGAEAPRDLAGASIVGSSVTVSRGAE
jgi:predicted AlkP superfamily phosphohydrolase/phosphomutase